MKSISMGPTTLAIDLQEDMALTYNNTGGSLYSVLVGETVFAVGWDKKYFVAKRYPKGDKTKMEYYYLVRFIHNQLDNPEDSVRGPFNEFDFKIIQKRLRLPDFSREIADLK